MGAHNLMVLIGSHPGRRRTVVTDAISRAVLGPIAIALGALIFLASVELSVQSESAATQSRIQANSNRESAGKLENGILTLHLELRQGDWYPEAETGPSMK